MGVKHFLTATVLLLGELGMISPAQALTPRPPNHQQLDDMWMLQYDHAPSGKFLADPRLRPVLQHLLPGARFAWDKRPLAALIPSLMAADQSTVTIQDNRFVTLSGTSPGLWTARSVLWFDTNPAGPICIFAYIQNDSPASAAAGTSPEADIYTAFESFDNLPTQFVSFLTNYLSHLNPGTSLTASVHLSDGSSRPLKLSTNSAHQ